MDIIEFTDKQDDGRYYYKGYLLGNEYKHIKGLEAIYVSNKHEYTGWYGNLDESTSYDRLVSHSIEYTFYLPQFDVYRIYRNDTRRKTKFAKVLDECDQNKRFMLNCIVDPSKEHIISDKCVLENKLFVHVYKFELVDGNL